MSEQAKSIIEAVIQAAGGWCVAPGENAITELENKIDDLIGIRIDHNALYWDLRKAISRDMYRIAHRDEDTPHTPAEAEAFANRVGEFFLEGFNIYCLSRSITKCLVIFDRHFTGAGREQRPLHNDAARRTDGDAQALAGNLKDVPQVEESPNEP